MEEKKQYNPAPAILLPAIVAVLGSVAAVTGLASKNLYRDNDFVKTAWLANDWVTAVIVLPAFLNTMWLSKKSVKARLVLPGLLGYLFYNYAFYLFGAVFNALFLIYAGIVFFSAAAIIRLMVNFPVKDIVVSGKAIRWICPYLIMIVLMLGAIEIGPSILFIVNGVLPNIVLHSGHPTSIVYALDLTIVVPLCLVAAVWLWQLKPWGVIVAAIMLVKAICYGLVLCAATWLLMNRKLAVDPLLPFYLFITLGGVAGMWWLLKNSSVKT